MTISDAITIATERFRLREIEEMDREPFLACLRDPGFSVFHTQAELDPRHLYHVFDRFLRWKSERPRYNVQLAVVGQSKPDGYLGTVGVRTEGLDPGTGEIGIELVRSIWGTGAAREVTAAFVDWIEMHMGVRWWIAETAPGNVAAERLARSAGLVLVSTDGKRHWRTGGRAS